MSCKFDKPSVPYVDTFSFICDVCVVIIHSSGDFHLEFFSMFIWPLNVIFVFCHYSFMYRKTIESTVIQNPNNSICKFLNLRRESRAFSALDGLTYCLQSFTKFGMHKRNTFTFVRILPKTVCCCVVIELFS